MRQELLQLIKLLCLWAHVCAQAVDKSGKALAAVSLECADPTMVPMISSPEGP